MKISWLELNQQFKQLECTPPKFALTMRKKLIKFGFPVLLFAIAFVQYANTLNFDFAWDDKLVITANDYTRMGLKGLPEILTNPLSVPYKNVYRPVTQSLFAIEYELFGDDPTMFHLFGLIWYGLACLSVYFFLKFVFPRIHPVFLFLASLLFTVHPLHVEVVANIKSRDEVLALLFGLTGIILFAGGIERNRLGTIALGIISFGLAVLSKENAITLLPMLPVVLWFRSEQVQLNRKIILSGIAVLGLLGLYFMLIPLVVLSLLLVLVVYRKLGRKKLIFLALGGIILSALFFNFEIDTPDTTNGIQLDSTVLNNIFLWTTESEKVIPTSIVNIGRYFKLFALPHPLIHLYGYNQIPLSGWGNLVTWLVLILLLFSVYYWVRNFRRKDLSIFGILFFICTYSVYSNFFVIAPDTMADRYMFLPSIGLSLVVVEGLIRLGKLNRLHPIFSTPRSKIVAVFFFFAISALFARSWIGSRDWQNDYTLIKNRIQYMENNAAAQATLGIMIQRESMEVKDGQLQQRLRSDAAKAFTKAIDIYPDFYLAWTLIGKIFVEEGMYEKAELAFLRAQGISPLSPDAYQCLGALYFVVGDSNRSIDYLEKCILLDPQLKEAYVMLGKAYIQNKSIKNLGSLTKAALGWFPNNPDFEAFQAFYLLDEKKFTEAYRYAKASLEKDPNNLLALSVLAAPQMAQLPQINP